MPASSQHPVLQSLDSKAHVKFLLVVLICRGLQCRERIKKKKIIMEILPVLIALGCRFSDSDAVLGVQTPA